MWPIYFINPVDKTTLSCYTPHRRSTAVSLETYPLDEFKHICLLTRVVVLLVIHLLRSHGNEVKQSQLIDRWPLILFEKLSTAFTANVRKL